MALTTTEDLENKLKALEKSEKEFFDATAKKIIEVAKEITEYHLDPFRLYQLPEDYCEQCNEVYVSLGRPKEEGKKSEIIIFEEHDCCGDVNAIKVAELSEFLSTNVPQYAFDVLIRSLQSAEQYIVRNKPDLRKFPLKP